MATEERLRTTIELKDEMTGTAKRVAESFEVMGDSADDMAASVDKAEGRLSKIKSALAGVAKRHKMQLDAVNVAQVQTKIGGVQEQIEKLTGRPATIKATAQVNRSQLKEARNEVKQLKAELEAMTGRKYDIDLDIEGASGGLSSKLSGVAGAVKGALPAVVAGAATAGIGGMISMGSERQQYRNNMEFFLGNEKDANAMMEWASDNAAKTQFSSGEVMGATSRAIQVSGGDMDMAKRYVQMAQDMASLQPEKSISDAMEALADASRGEMERMKDFGFTGTQEDWENAGMDMFAMTDRVSGKTMDELFTGGTEAGMQSAAAKWGTITGNLEDAVATIGEQLLNGLSPALDWFIGVSESAGEALSGTLSTLGGVFMSLWNAVQPLAPVFQTLWSIVSGVVSTAFNVLSSIVTGVVAPALEFLSNVVSAVLTPALEWLKEQGDALAESFQWVKDRAKDVYDWFGKVKNAVKDAVESLKGIGSAAIEAVRNSFGGFGGKILDFIKWGFSNDYAENAQGAISFEGGFTQMNENARGEIVQLPRGSKIYPYSTTQKIIRDMVGKTDTGQKPQGRAIAEALARPVNNVSNNNVFNVSIDARGSNLSKQEVRRLKNEIVNSIVEAFDNTVPA